MIFHCTKEFLQKSITFPCRVKPKSTTVISKFSTKKSQIHFFFPNIYLYTTQVLRQVTHFQIKKKRQVTPLIKSSLRYSSLNPKLVGVNNKDHCRYSAMWILFTNLHDHSKESFSILLTEIGLRLLSHG